MILSSNAKHLAIRKIWRHFQRSTNKFLVKIRFIYGSLLVANKNKKTMVTRKMFRRSLRFCGEGVARLDGLHEDEFVRALE